MKQKRKVKSLLPNKKRNKSPATFLLVLGIVLCLGSASLWTISSVYGQNLSVKENEVQDFNYESWIDDKYEAVYRAMFVESGTLETGSEMYMKNNSLYITEKPVIVNPVEYDGSMKRVNEVEDGVYGHVLGGTGNKVYSDNVTLIAGKGNNVSGNDNATVLGGIDNTFEQVKSNGVPIVVVGGEDNKVGSDHDGVALIGGEKNIVGGNVSNVSILGGEENTVGNNVSNIIVGGKNVEIGDGKKDIFAYSNSDSQFSPKTDGAFYLNLQKGVGFGTGNGDEGLSVKGAISFGEIDINSLDCDNGNLGVIGSYKGCLIGCTQVGIGPSKWELLDRSDECVEICKDNSNYCLFQTDTTINGVNEYSTEAICPDLDAKYGTSYLCTTGNLKNYKNVVFDNILIDSDDDCLTGENKCVYKCEEGYHLVDKKCYKDCALPWNPSESIQHNQTVTGYNVADVACSDYEYKFPSKSSYYWASGHIEIWPNGIPGFSSNPGVGGYGAYESCTNYNHKKRLVCYDGTLYLAKADGTKSDKIAEKYGFVFENCALHEHRCQTGNAHYNLTREFIINTGLDTITIWNTEDRGETKGKRGTYKLCLDWNSVDPSKNDKCHTVDNDTNGYYEQHYKLVGCEVGYSTGVSHPFVCMRDCTWTGNNGNSKTIHHDGVINVYLSGSEICTGVCQRATFMCVDGNWEYKSSYLKSTPTDIESYKYSDCTVIGVPCNGFDVSRDVRDQYINTSIYEECQPYSAPDKFMCIEKNLKYKLVGCITGYHANETKEYCIPNARSEKCSPLPDNAHWVRKGIISDHYWNTYLLLQHKFDLYEGEYLVQWKPSCEWNDDKSYCWEGEDMKIPFDNMCDWDCDPHFRPNGNYCEPINYNCGSTKYTCEDSQVSAEIWSDSPIPNEDGVNTYRWDCGITKGCHACDDDSSWSEEYNMCVMNEDGQCVNDKGEIKCDPGTPVFRGDILDDYNNIIGRRWDCKGKGNGSTGLDCHYCIEGYHWGGSTCLKDEEAQCDNDKGEVKCIYPAEPDNEQRIKDDGKTIGYKWDCEIEYNGSRAEGCHYCDGDQGYYWNSSTLTCEKEDEPEPELPECGTANGKYFSDDFFPPLEFTLCSGVSKEIERPQQMDDDYLWKCDEIQCKANRVACGGAAGNSYQNIDNIPENDLCNSKSKVQEGSLELNADGTGFKWNCASGGIEVRCEAKKSDCLNSIIVNPNGGKITKTDDSSVKSEQTRNGECGSTDRLFKNISKDGKTNNKSCIINYNGNGGTPKRSSDSLSFERKITYSLGSWKEEGYCNGFIDELFKYTFPADKKDACKQTAQWNSTTGDWSYKSDINMPGATRDEHRFLGWYTSTGDDGVPMGGSGNKLDLSKLGITSSPEGCPKTLYAKWEKILISYECVNWKENLECTDGKKGTKTTPQNPEDGKLYWTCPGSTDVCETCDTGLGYKHAVDGEGNDICVKIECNHCATSGFPYCFPIDFNSTCDEWEYVIN